MRFAYRTTFAICKIGLYFLKECCCRLEVTVLNIFLIISGVIMIIVSLLIIVAVSMQETTKGGMGALTGDAEERIGKNCN